MGSLAKRNGISSKREELADQAVGRWALMNVPGGRLVEKKFAQLREVGLLAGPHHKAVLLGFAAQAELPGEPADFLVRDHLARESQEPSAGERTRCPKAPLQSSASRL